MIFSVATRANLKNGSFLYLYDFVTTVKLHTNEQETRLSHKPRYAFVTQTRLTLMNQKHICIINHVINLSHKPW